LALGLLFDLLGGARFRAPLQLTRAIQVTASGWFFVRSVAMVFDRYLQHGQEGQRWLCVI